MKLNFKREYVIAGVALVIILIVLVIYMGWFKTPNNISTDRDEPEPNILKRNIIEPDTQEPNILKPNIIERDSNIPLDIFDELRQIGNYYNVNFYKLNEANINSELTKYEDLYKSNPDKLNGIKQYFELVRLYLEFKKLNDQQNKEYTQFRPMAEHGHMMGEYKRVLDNISDFRAKYYKALKEIDKDSTVGVEITTDYYDPKALMPRKTFNDIFENAYSFAEMHLKITQFYALEKVNVYDIYNIYIDYYELLSDFIREHPDKLGLQNFVDFKIY